MVGDHCLFRHTSLLRNADDGLVVFPLSHEMYLIEFLAQF